MYHKPKPSLGPTTIHLGQAWKTHAFNSLYNNNNNNNKNNNKNNMSSTIFSSL